MTLQEDMTLEVLFSPLEEELLIQLVQLVIRGMNGPTTLEIFGENFHGQAEPTYHTATLL